ncbi:ABC-type amino acid transport substrate-binding protein [Formivibrio citricus]|uniref:ABC-type amino acid transport substrate-binding protein n=1 Tax=Formivibrio citricus TaxID=83765 RepID=A0A1I4WE21_9NEIS|nr:transporter substrate-binding domain-containing protein [Formivibrio citricus]SFN11657.1 ABC-type amino acid transport substrate-binding protein [Formivibrio citricus]
MLKVTKWLGMCLLALLPVWAWAAPFQVKTLSQKNYPAKYDPSNPAKPGICLEIIRAIERLDPQIKFTGLDTLVTTTRALDHLTHGEIDVFFGFLKTPHRVAAVNFIEPPLFSMPQVLVVRRDDPVQLNSWDDIRTQGRNGTVLAVANSGQAVFLKKRPGIFVDDSGFTVTTNLKKLLADRGRFIYVSENNARAGIESLGVTGQVKILRPPFLMKDSLHVAFSRQASPDLVGRVVEAIRKLERNGEMKRIRQRYHVE